MKPSPWRVIFMGTPAFAVPTLQALLAAQENVIAVITQPDKPRGRGQKVSPSPVKELAQAHGLPVLQPAKLKDPAFLGALRGLFGTTIITPDNVMTLVGNGKVFGDTIQNFSTLPVRRVDRTAQLAGGVDVADAIARFKAAVEKIPNVSTKPAPDVALLDINLVGPVIAVRPYCHTDHYWQVYFDTNESIVRTCQEAGWPAPTPTHIAKLMQLPC